MLRVILKRLMQPVVPRRKGGEVGSHCRPAITVVGAVPAPGVRGSMRCDCDTCMRDPLAGWTYPIGTNITRGLSHSERPLQHLVIAIASGTTPPGFRVKRPSGPSILQKRTPRSAGAINMGCGPLARICRSSHTGTVLVGAKCGISKYEYGGMVIALLYSEVKLTRP